MNIYRYEPPADRQFREEQERHQRERFTPPATPYQLLNEIRMHLDGGEAVLAYEAAHQLTTMLERKVRT